MMYKGKGNVMDVKEITIVVPLFELNRWRDATCFRFGVAAPNTVKFCLQGITPVTVHSSSVISATSFFFPSSQFSTTAFPMATADVQEIRATSYVGFDSITQQIEHKLLKRGFQFNVIVVGASRVPFLTV